MAGYLTKRNGTVKISAGSLDYTFDDVGDFSCGGIQEGGRGAAAIIHRGAIFSPINSWMRRCSAMIALMEALPPPILAPPSRSISKT